jgi:hypothetical protein
VSRNIHESPAPGSVDIESDSEDRRAGRLEAGPQHPVWSKNNLGVNVTFIALANFWENGLENNGNASSGGVV